MYIKIRFLGAAQNVTGSRYLVETDKVQFLVDCGLFQERDMQAHNWDPEPLPVRDLDAVLITHAHVDHCGLLPKLVKDGYRQRVHSTAATAEIARIILLDNAHLQMEDAAYKRRRHEREGRRGPYPEEPLYTPEDVRACEPLFAPIRYAAPLHLAPGVTAAFYEAGHVLGSSMVRVHISQDGQERVLLFSGDLGRGGKPILRDPTSFSEADYVIVESTYGDRVHQEREAVLDSLSEVVTSTLAKGGNVVIPSFALERSQEVLYEMNQLLVQGRVSRLRVFVDSPMAVSITEVFERHPELFDQEMTKLMRMGESPFDFPGLTMCTTVEESKTINSVQGGAIIIAGSGMCTGGRIKHHLVHNISRPECTVLFVGYQANGTLGRHIVDGADEVRILGEMRPVRARIEKIDGFSSHADRDELFRWLSALQRAPRRVFVVHGEPEAAQHFAAFVHERTGWNTYVPEPMEEVLLE